MNCHRADDFLSPYLAGELSPALAAGLEQHLVGCVRCRGELVSMRRAHAALQAVPAAATPAGLLEQFHSRLSADPRRSMTPAPASRLTLPRNALRWPILAPLGALAATLLVAVMTHPFQSAPGVQGGGPASPSAAPRIALAPRQEVAPGLAPQLGGDRSAANGKPQPLVPVAKPARRPGRGKVATYLARRPVLPDAPGELDRPWSRADAPKDTTSVPRRQQPPKSRPLLLPYGVPQPGRVTKKPRFSEPLLPPAGGRSPAANAATAAVPPRDQPAAPPAAPVLAQAPAPSAGPTADDRGLAPPASGPQLATAPPPPPTPSRDEAERGAGGAFGWVRIVRTGSLQKASGLSAAGASATSAETSSAAAVGSTAEESRQSGAGEIAAARSRGSGRPVTAGRSAPAVSAVLLTSLRREVNLQVADVPLPELVARLEVSARTAISLDPSVPGDLRAHAELRGLHLYEALQKIGEAAELVVVPQGSGVILRPRAAVPTVNTRQPVWSGDWGPAPQNLFAVPAPGPEKRR